MLESERVVEGMTIMTTEKILSLDPPVDDPISKMAHRIIRRIVTKFPEKIDEIEEEAQLEEKESNLLKVDTENLKEEYFEIRKKLKSKIGNFDDNENDFSKLRKWGVISLLFIVVQVELTVRGLSIKDLLARHHV